MLYIYSLLKSELSDLKTNMSSRPESGVSKTEKTLQLEAQQRANEKLKLPENKKPSVLGMISHKLSIETFFGHKYFK